MAHDILIAHQGAQRHFGFSYNAGVAIAAKQGGTIRLGDGVKRPPSDVRVFDARTGRLKRTEAPTYYEGINH